MIPEPTHGLRLHVVRPFSNNSRVVKFARRPKVKIKRHGPVGGPQIITPGSPTRGKLVSNSQQTLWESLYLQHHLAALHSGHLSERRSPTHPFILCVRLPPSVLIDGATCSPGKENEKKKGKHIIRHMLDERLCSSDER